MNQEQVEQLQQQQQQRQSDMFLGDAEEGLEGLNIDDDDDEQHHYDDNDMNNKNKNRHHPHQHPFVVVATPPGGGGGLPPQSPLLQGQQPHVVLITKGNSSSIPRDPSMLSSSTLSELSVRDEEDHHHTQHPQRSGPEQQQQNHQQQQQQIQLSQQQLFQQQQLLQQQQQKHGNQLSGGNNNCNPNRVIVLMMRDDEAIQGNSTNNNELLHDYHGDDDDDINDHNDDPDHPANAGSSGMGLRSSSVDEHYMASFRPSTHQQHQDQMQNVVSEPMNLLAKNNNNYYNNYYTRMIMQQQYQQFQQQQQQQQTQHRPTPQQQQQQQQPLTPQQPSAGNVNNNTATSTMRRSQTPAATLQRMNHYNSNNNNAPEEDESSSGSQRHSQNSSSRDWGWFEDVHVMGTPAEGGTPIANCATAAIMMMNNHNNNNNRGGPAGSDYRGGYATGAGASPAGGRYPNHPLALRDPATGAEVEPENAAGVRYGHHTLHGNNNNNNNNYHQQQQQHHNNNHHHNHHHSKKRGLVPQVSGEVNEILQKHDSNTDAAAMAVTAPTYVLEESLSSQKLWKVTAGQRPPQPVEERAFFEKMWAQNFARSQVKYDMPVEVLTATSPISLSPFADGNFSCEDDCVVGSSGGIVQGSVDMVNYSALPLTVNHKKGEGGGDQEAALVASRADNGMVQGGHSNHQSYGGLKQQVVNRRVRGHGSDGDLIVLVRGDNVFGTTVSKSFARASSKGGPIVGVDTVNISIASYRVVESKKRGKYAQFLVIYREGSIRDTVGVWKRYGDFEELARKVTHSQEGCATVIANMSPMAVTEEPETEHLPNAVTSWRLLKKRQRWYRCLDAGYLSLKVFLLERFLHDILFESSSPKLLREFVAAETCHEALMMKRELSETCSVGLLI